MLLLCWESKAWAIPWYLRIVMFLMSILSGFMGSWQLESRGLLIHCGHIHTCSMFDFTVEKSQYTLFNWEKEGERDRKSRERQRKGNVPTADSLPKSKDGSGRSQEPTPQSGSPLRVAWIQSLLVLPTPPRGCTSIKLQSEAQPGLKHRYSKVICRNAKCHPSYYAKILPLFSFK